MDHSVTIEARPWNELLFSILVRLGMMEDIVRLLVLYSCLPRNLVLMMTFVPRFETSKFSKQLDFSKNQ